MIQRVIDPSKDTRALINKLFVEIRINASEYAICIFEDLDLICVGAHRPERRYQRLGGANVTCSRCRRINSCFAWIHILTF
ncbi:hypothetical protein NBG4_10001 [Candidatus Sulfobium mesophilum]|uniref:Uncharacterized protein n=1 Tax=Candidatus Sulfobium mesophilum TaxID=2016548 RepID=A0A2U3QDI0_9BACT|nr:hypothetical protein NBG4_10001 [Candidatus Sulfobium mesophilum]